MTITIAQERPDTPDAIALVTELETYLASLYPPESRHGFSVEALVAQGVDFFVARQNSRPAGCVGALCVGLDYAEVKRMYVRPDFRGQGIGARLLERLEAHALARGICVLRLEMGVSQPEAGRLYARFGFRPIPPFGPYQPDPLCRFFEKRLA
jgi:GNAT superfamily N-acetyltransferase